MISIDYIYNKSIIVLRILSEFLDAAASEIYLLHLSVYYASKFSISVILLKPIGVGYFGHSKLQEGRETPDNRASHLKMCTLASPGLVSLSPLAMHM